MFFYEFFDHKDLGNHLLQLWHKFVQHPVYTTLKFLALQGAPHIHDINRLRVKRLPHSFAISPKHLKLSKSPKLVQPKGTPAVVTGRLPMAEGIALS
jgi:hypothetical protein